MISRRDLDLYICIRSQSSLCIVLYCIVSRRVVSYRVVSRRVASYRVVSRRVVSSRVVYFYGTSFKKNILFDEVDGILINNSFKINIIYIIALRIIADIFKN